MRLEADAAGERVTQAAALPDPKFRVELRDITKFGEQSPTVPPKETSGDVTGDMLMVSMALLCVFPSR